MLLENKSTCHALEEANDVCQLLVELTADNFKSQMQHTWLEHCMCVFIWEKRERNKSNHENKGITFMTLKDSVLK